MRNQKFLLTAAAILALAAPSFAADMDSPILVPAQDEYQPVEVGSGWYLRGDIGYAFNNKYERKEYLGEFSSDYGPISGSFGIGYHFNDFLRADLNLGILPTAKFARNDTIVGTGAGDPDGCFGYEPNVLTGALQEGYRPCYQSDEADNYAYDLMANAFVDLGTYSGLTPYLGAGLGVIYTNSSLERGRKNCVSDQIFQCSTDGIHYNGSAVSESTLNLQFALAAGLSYRLSDATSVDLGYEYKSAPGAKFYKIGDGGALEMNKGIDFHSAKLGFRYDLW